MKKLLLSFLFVAFAFTSMEVNAGTVTIDTVKVYNRTPCDLTNPIRFQTQIITSGYNPNDTISVIINYGDGHIDTSITYDSLNTIYHFANHTYSNAGQYSISVVAIGPDMAADTSINYNAVFLSDTCGNIKGQVFKDFNSDCNLNNNDVVFQRAKVNVIFNNQITFSTWTDTMGYYDFEVPVGQTYTVQFDSSNGYSVNCPSGGSYTVSTFPSVGNDFSVTCSGGFDLRSRFFGRSVPGQIMNSTIYARNTLCEAKSGTVKVVFDDTLFAYAGTSTPTHTAINGDTVEWNFSNVEYLNPSYFSINTYTDTTAQIGDTICVTVITTPIAGDSIPGNNIEEFCFPVRTSYDPNIKEVSPVGEGAAGNIAAGKDLTYTIHFQNTGTAQAYNIYILDSIDTNVLDPYSINVIDASHNVKTSLISPNQNVLRFRFDDINLPDSNTNEPASKGWVTYTIEQQSGLLNGDKIENSASIYFDYNPPIHTNTTLNTIDNRVVGIETVGDVEASFAKCYPNPASNLLNVSIDKNENVTVEISIYDISGQLIRQIKSNKRNQQINVSTYPSGLYFLEIRAEDGKRQMNKFVVGN